MAMIEAIQTRQFNEDALPVFAPDPALRERILAAHARQQRQRRTRALIGGGALAASVALTVLLAARQAPMPQTAARMDAASTARNESRELELEWQRASAQLTHASTPHLRAIDAQLQSAYDRGADAREVSALWARRNAALRQLIEASSEGIVAASDGGVTRL